MVTGSIDMAQALSELQNDSQAHRNSESWTSWGANVKPSYVFLCEIAPADPMSGSQRVLELPDTPCMYVCMYVGM